MDERESSLKKWMIVILVALIGGSIFGPTIFTMLNEIRVIEPVNTGVYADCVQIYESRRWGTGAGLRHGPYRIETQRGQVLYEGEFDDGLQVGLWRRWDRSGHLAQEQFFDADVLVSSRRDPPWQHPVLGEEERHYEDSLERALAEQEKDPEDLGLRRQVPFLYRRLALFASKREDEAASKRYWESALAWYQANAAREAAEIEDHNSAAWYILECPHEELRDIELARELAHNAVETEPDNRSYLDTLALAFFLSGDPLSAQELQRKALKGISKKDEPFVWEEYNARLERYEK